MPLYVHALADALVKAWQEDDGRRIESLVFGDTVALVERRDAGPPLTESELRRQHDIVFRIAAVVPAIIPARFGSLLDEAELAAILRVRQDLIRSTFDHVREHVQMTLRIASAEEPAVAGPARSGRDYLLRRRGEVAPVAPATAEPVLRALRPFVRDERIKRGDRDTLTIYHLVRRSDVDRYRAAIAAATIAITASGPFAPFAFAPDLFS